MEVAHNKGKTVVKQKDEYEDLLAEENIYEPKLFTYPDHKVPSAVFEYDDLDNEESLLVLCARAKPDDENR